MKPSPQAFRSAAAIHRAGLAAARPAADDVLAGTLYFSTDTGVTERSDGTTWAAYSGAGGGGQAPSVTEGQLLGRGSTSGDGPAEEINPGEYIAMTGDQIDVAGAGATSFIVQSLSAARAAVAGLGKAPADYLPNAQEMALLPSGHVTVTTGTGVLGSTPTIPAASLPPTIAYTDQANVFTQNQTVAKALPIVVFTDTRGLADQRTFQLYSGGSAFFINAANDAGTISQGYLSLTRSGDVSLRDLYEKQRPVPMGHWQAVPFNPANFTGPFTWGGISASNVTLNQYALVGRMLNWKININGFGLTGAGPGNPTLVIPGGFTSAVAGSIGPCTIYNPGTTSWGAGSIDVQMGSSTITATVLPGFTWLAATGNYLWINVTIPIQ
jgi:hypothetical protein